jgi:hypothetical protein
MKITIEKNGFSPTSLISEALEEKHTFVFPVGDKSRERAKGLVLARTREAGCKGD